LNVKKYIITKKYSIKYLIIIILLINECYEKFGQLN